MTSSTATIYDTIGGAPAVRQLVQRFYLLMDIQPETYQLRQMHPQTLTLSEEKLFEYLSGWLGGPALYIEKNGHPRLRMRHRFYAVGPAVRDQWMLCMTQALREQVEDSQLLELLINQFAQMADHMINTNEPAFSAAHV